MLELDVNDALPLSDTIIFHPFPIKRSRIRQSKQYMETVIKYNRSKLLNKSDKMVPI